MYSNTTDSLDEIQREFSLLFTPEFVTVRVKVQWLNDILCVPSVSGEEVVEAEFTPMTCGIYWEIEKESEYIVEYQKSEIPENDRQTMRTLYLQRGLKKWSLPVPLEFNDIGHLTEECMARVTSLPAPLITAILAKYEETMYIDSEEEVEISKQAARLFRKNSQGVENACEAVSLYCTLGNFWDKFGLNRFQLREIPYRDFMRLRLMVSKEHKAHATEPRGSQGTGSNTRVSTGGRTRPSRAIVQPDNFQDLRGKI